MEETRGLLPPPCFFFFFLLSPFFLLPTALPSFLGFPSQAEAADPSGAEQPQDFQIQREEETLQKQQFCKKAVRKKSRAISDPFEFNERIGWHQWCPQMLHSSNATICQVPSVATEKKRKQLRSGKEVNTLESGSLGVCESLQ